MKSQGRDGSYWIYLSLMGVSILQLKNRKARSVFQFGIFSHPILRKKLCIVI